MFKEKVSELVELALEKKQGIFLIELISTPDHKIRVVLDGDQGVVLKIVLMLAERLNII